MSSSADGWVGLRRSRRILSCQLAPFRSMTYVHNNDHLLLPRGHKVDGSFTAGQRGSCGNLKSSQRKNEMSNLSRRFLRVLPPWSHVNDRSSVHVESSNDAAWSVQSLLHLHFARLCFDPDVIWSDEFRLVLSPPLHRVLDPLLCVRHLPLGSSHVSGDTSWVFEKTSFPGVVRIFLIQHDRVRVLSDKPISAAVQLLGINSDKPRAVPQSVLIVSLKSL